MFFASDNWAGAHPKVSEALAAHAGGFAAAYGASELDRKVGERFSEVFEREVAVFFVGTGTAANALALAAVSPPGGVCFCHAESHMLEDECGAPEFLSAGGRLRAVAGPLGRMDGGALERAVGHFSPGEVHGGRAAAVSLTQTTEVGTVYGLDAIGAAGELCRAKGLALHMDGARFANALVALGCSPAEMTWRRGVDLLSFGGTKNGCWCAEALVFFDPARAREFPYLRKRAAQLFSKTRFVAAQFEAYFEDGLWLENARHANRMAGMLADAMRGAGRVRLAWEPEANEVFGVMGVGEVRRLREAGAVFYEWKAPSGMGRRGGGRGVVPIRDELWTTEGRWNGSQW
jgi:threonine aldolase